MDHSMETVEETVKTKKKFKWWIIPIVIVGLIAAILLGGRLFFRLPVSDYYAASRPAFGIPGLSDGYVPQALDYSKELDRMILSGYMKDGSPSPVYVVDYKTGDVDATVTLTLSDGTLSHSHSGGLAVHNGLLYTCDSGNDVLHVFKIEDLGAIKGEGTIKEIGTVPVHSDGDAVSPAFVAAGPEGLVVGEFYIAKSYETPVSHYVDDHHALAVLLPYDDSELGVSAVPTRAYSLPDKAQGMCFDEDGLMYVSESWAVSSSVIEVFRLGEPTGEIQVLGRTLPLVMLGDENRVSSKKIAPMSEEIVILNGELYVNCESASKKYFFGLLNGAQNLFATDVEFFKGE